jgi:uncharacterized protein (UPF0261 family)
MGYGSQTSTLLLMMTLTSAIGLAVAGLSGRLCVKYIKSRTTDSLDVLVTLAVPIGGKDG